MYGGLKEGGKMCSLTRQEHAGRISGHQTTRVKEAQKCCCLPGLWSDFFFFFSIVVIFFDSKKRTDWRSPEIG